jgi:hypothetical protein
VTVNEQLLLAAVLASWVKTCLWLCKMMFVVAVELKLLQLVSPFSF